MCKGCSGHFKGIVALDFWKAKNYSNVCRRASLLSAGKSWIINYPMNSSWREHHCSLLSFSFTFHDSPIIISQTSLISTFPFLSAPVFPLQTFLNVRGLFWKAEFYSAPPDFSVDKLHDFLDAIASLASTYPASWEKSDVSTSRDRSASRRIRAFTYLHTYLCL